MDFIYWLLGMPGRVMAEMGTLLNPRIPNDNAIAVFRYADGRFAEVSCTFAAVAGENTLRSSARTGRSSAITATWSAVASPRPPGGIQLKWYLDDEAGMDGERYPGHQRRRANGSPDWPAPLAEFLPGGGRRSPRRRKAATCCAWCWPVTNPRLPGSVVTITTGHKGQGDATRMARKTNLLLIGIDSLRADHMSLYGYPRLTTPHMDKFMPARRGVRERLQPAHPHHARLHLDVHGHGLLRHGRGGAAAPGRAGDEAARRWRKSWARQGYATTCVGFSGNPASRGFQKYLDFAGWGSLGRRGAATRRRT